jgi:glyoxylase-like metal-dependent hydrolase (beta-lactamase superfamily II)
MQVNLSRRAFLKSAGMAAIAATLPPAFQSAKTLAQSPLQNARSYNFKLGNFKLSSVSDGILRPPASLFSGSASPEQLAAVLRAGFQSETLTVDCNILLVDTGNSKVLVDSGNGSLNGETAGKLLANLAGMQIRPSDITSIIITHAHGDHVGGLVDASGKPLFPNARYYISETEWSFWMNPRVSLPNLRGGAEMARSFITTAQKQLGAIRDRVTRFAMNREIIPGFTALPTPGHTPGHIALQITSGNATVIHTADLVHIHTINLWNPDWQPIFDADPVQAAATRQQVLAQIASDRTLMFAYHFPFPGVGYLRSRNPKGFEWEPIHWQSAV